ncbi:MAG: UDP-N-acetylenolpyruvoylglucosamine reductase [Candidatus Hydrogenedentes bacterium CG07_land_8_20_14_0_80_42_17]|nr:MAG: UDP-N-acetylenolpyruvoylglucosamine reductase [Candidatus Hydrogenedentes bacterium CG07_land_8_20_14_0_80_42_17]
MSDTKIFLGSNGGTINNLSIEEVMNLLGSVKNEPLYKHTHFKIGGPADWFFIAQTPDDLSVARIVARSRGMAMFIIGAGSNLLVSDEGLRGLVIKLGGAFTSLEEDADSGLMKVGAAVRLPDLARAFKDRNASGLEWAFGVPGTVGGAIFMNAGTDLGEMKDVIEKVIVEGRGGTVCETNATACGFGYRTSRFQHTGEFILFAIVRLGNSPFREDMARTALEHRKNTQPLQLPNCGSVFANPQNDFAARLIEEAGLKGHTIGGAQISTMHANFIVNLGNAKAQDVKALIDLAKMEVKNKFGIELRSEVRMLGKF